MRYTPTDLTVSKTHTGNFLQGQSGATYTITVKNIGAPTTGQVTVLDKLPQGLTATAISGTGWTCALGTLSCARSDTLAGGASYPAITLTVNVGSNAGPIVTNQATISGGGDQNAANNTATDTTIVTPPPDLAITKSHVGNFTFGQNGATYSIVVNNGGPASTVGTVIVTDTLPSGLTAVNLAGNGWNCTLNTLTCTRNDALGAGGVYPTITLTVNVSANAVSPLTNTAQVSGGGEQNFANDTANDPTTIIPAPPVFTALSGNGQFGTVGQPLGSPLLVKLTTSGGVAIAGVAVTFSATMGGGTLNGGSQVVVNTDSLGIASAGLSLGPSPGVNTVQATTASANPVNFSATGIGAITLTSGNNQFGPVASALPQPLVVTLIGAGSPIANTPVTFSVTAGGGLVSATTVNTDAQGKASTILTLGPSAGTNTVSVSAGTLTGSPITFSAAAQPLTGINAVPNPLTFGDVPMFTSHHQTITLTSIGTQPVTVTAVNIAGNFFSLSGLPTLPVTILPTSSVSFQAVFSPVVTAPVSASISVSTAETTAPFTVLVTGNGVPPPLPAPNVITAATDKSTYTRGQPVQIAGQVTAADGTGIANLPVQIQVTVNGSARTLNSYTDSQGSYKNVFMPTADDGGSFAVSAAVSSSSVTKSAETGFRIIGALVMPNSVAQDQVMGTTTTIPLSVQNIADGTLSNLNYTATVIPAGALSVSLPPSVGSLGPGGAATVPVSITVPGGNPPSIPVSVQIQISGTDAQSNLTDQENASFTISLHPAVSTPVLLPTPIDLGINPGKNLTANLYVQNNGYLPITGGVISIQNADQNTWVSLGNASLGILNHGDLRQFQLNATPPANLALGDYQFTINLTNGGNTTPLGNFTITVTHLTVGSAYFVVADDTGSMVGGATITLYGKTNNKTFTAMTGTEGTATLSGVDAGDYSYVVAAPLHDPVSGTITVAANATANASVILSYDVVNLTFTVTPTTIVDQYNVTLNVTYSTTLPKPALQIAPYSLQFSFFPEDVPDGKLACKLNVTNTHPTATVRNLTLDSSQLDVAQPQGQRIHVYFGDGLQVYEVGDLAGKASVDVPCYATLDTGEIPTHSAGNLVVRANYNYSMQGLILQGTTTTNVPVSYVRPQDLQYDPIPFVYDKKTDPANPVLKYDAGSYVYTVKSNRNIELDLSQPTGIPFNGHNLVAFVQTQAGADDLATINANQANVFWHTNFNAQKQSLLVSGDRSTFDISTLDAGLTLQDAISAQIVQNPSQALNQPMYLGLEGQWADESSPTGYLIPVHIMTITPDGITVPQPPSSPTVGCLNISDPQCQDPKLPNQPPTIASGEGQIILAIDQVVKLEREAYNAMLGIGAQTTLSNVVASIHITDANGADVSSKFIILITGDSAGATHRGTIAGQASVSWQLIPNSSAGGSTSSGQQYKVQATLNYTVNGVPKMAMTQVITITVLPAPKLNVAYSLPYVVVPGKDAYLRVTVQNVGVGTAHNLSIQSLNPRIVETIPAYPIDPTGDIPGPYVAFDFTGSSNKPDASGFQQGNLTVNFGDVAPGATVSGYWTLRVSRRGFFIDVNATFKHQDYEGIQLDPLINAPTTSLVPAIGGQITASGGQPVPNVTVTLIQDNKAVGTDTTDISGNYYIPDVAVGAYLEQVTDIAGKILYTQSVIVLADQGTNFIDIMLQTYDPTQALVVVSSNPTGFVFTADGDSYTTPHSFVWAVGSTHTLSAASTSTTPSSTMPQLRAVAPSSAPATAQPGFVGWGDGETSSTRVITVTSFGAVYQALTTASDSANRYSRTPITPDPNYPNDANIDHKWPSINNNGDMVWTQLVGTNWQVFEQTARGIRAQITTDAHDHERPAIADDGTIGWFQNNTGGGLGYAIYRLVPGGKPAIIEFSSRNNNCPVTYPPPFYIPVPTGPCTSQEHDAGKNFGMSSDGNIISYFSFYYNGDPQDRPFDVSSLTSEGPIKDSTGNKIEFLGYDSPDLNATNALVYSDDFTGAGNIFLATLDAPLNSTTIDGPANPQQTGGPLPVAGANQAISPPRAKYPHISDGTAPEIAYIRENANVTHWPGKDPAQWVDVGAFADIAGSGSNAKIIYEKIVNGYSQIWIATPSIPGPFGLSCPNPDGVVGEPYSSAFLASGGLPPYSQFTVNGQLPPGLTLNTGNGSITGSPTQADTFEFSGTVTDFMGTISTTMCTITVSDTSCPLTIGKASLRGTPSKQGQTQCNKCKQVVSNAQLVCRPLDDQGGIPGYLLGRHCYVLLRDASGMPYTFGAYDIDNQLTPAKDGDPTSPPGGCGGGLRNSVCVDLPNVPPDIFCTLESSVAAGPHGTYNFVSNNSNLWIHDQLAAAGLTPAFPSTAIMNKAQACAVKPIIFAQLAQAGIQLPVAQRIWAFAFGLTCP